MTRYTNPAFSDEFLIQHTEPEQEKQRARTLANGAISSGKIAKDNFCWWCLTTNKRLSAHHEDYSKPLEIVWLCGRCHFSAKFNWAGPRWALISRSKRNVRPNHFIEPCEKMGCESIKVTVLFTTEQKEGLDRIAKKLMKYRSKQLKGYANKERITSNMLIRALIQNFVKRENLIELSALSNEEDVIKLVENVFRGH